VKFHRILLIGFVVSSLSLACAGATVQATPGGGGSQSAGGANAGGAGSDGGAGGHIVIINNRKLST
jgi:hypothetical protein